MLVFDTSILIDLERNNKFTIEKIKELIDKYPISAKISFINFFEFIEGLKKRNPRNIKIARKFINKFKILKIRKKTAEILADLKIKYSKAGITLSLSDLIIASQVIENNMVLVTKDKDFEKIKELKKDIL